MWLGERVSRLWARGHLAARASTSWALIALPVVLVAGGQAWQYDTVLALIQRNGLEQVYGIPASYYRQAFSVAARLQAESPGEPLYVWSPERARETVAYYAESYGLPVRQSTEPQQLLLGPETGRDRFYMLTFGGPLEAARLADLGLMELPDKAVVVPGGQTTIRFFRLPAGGRDRILSTLQNEGPYSRFDNGLRLARWSILPGHPRQTACA